MWSSIILQQFLLVIVNLIIGFSALGRGKHCTEEKREAIKKFRKLGKMYK